MAIVVKTVWGLINGDEDRDGYFKVNLIIPIHIKVRWGKAKKGTGKNQEGHPKVVEMFVTIKVDTDPEYSGALKDLLKRVREGYKKNGKDFIETLKRAVFSVGGARSLLRYYGKELNPEGYDRSLNGYYALLYIDKNRSKPDLIVVRGKIILY